MIRAYSTSFFPTVKIMVSIKVCPVSHKLLLTICCWGIFIICSCLDSVFFSKRRVWYWFTSLIILRTQTYLVQACISITFTKNKPSSEQKQTSSPCLPPACAAPSRCISVASWNICFCCAKNCLFVLTIRPWCFSFHFLNLSKVVIQFQVLRGFEFLETQYDHLLKAGVHDGVQSAHLLHFREVVKGSTQPICNLQE